MGQDLGGDDTDNLFDINIASNNDIILFGHSRSSISGEKTQNNVGFDDFWMVKTDSLGNKLFDKTIGGSSGDYATKIIITPDGGYLMAGFSISNISGDKTQSTRGGYDYWLVKLDSAGNKIWDKAYGGPLLDYLFDFIPTTDGNYIFAGYSSSNIGFEKTDTSRGGFDFWLVKIDTSGNVIWDKTYGGTNNDYLEVIKNTPDGGYLMGGTSYSNAGADKTDSLIGGANTDFWIIKIDSAGSKLWDKGIGGDSTDALADIIQTQDGNYVLAGSSKSGIGFNKTTTNKGGDDYWIVKMDPNGNVLWDKTIGGSGLDNCFTIIETTDGGFALGGFSSSAISGDKTDSLRGVNDIWIVRLAAPFGVSVSSTNVGCFGNNDGTITVSAFGGIPPYSYLWSNNSTTSSVTGLNAGNFILTVSDASGGIIVDTIVISQPDSINITLNTLNTLCYGVNDGVATAMVSGGVSPYLFNWSNNQTTSVASGLSAGNYTLTVKDFNNCQNFKSTAINSSISIAISFIDLYNEICNMSDGAVTAKPSNGTPPYNFSWSNGTVDSSIFMIKAGTYTVTITDSLGCYEINNVVITNIPGPCDAVWPGDVDNDSVSNNIDILGIGLHFNKSGPQRSIKGNMWKCHFSLNWNDTLADGSDIKHVDCNGDGKINEDDTLALNLNFQYIVNKKPILNVFNPINPDLYFEVLTPNVAPGTDIEVKIMAGKDSVSLYGLTFDIQLAPALIDTNSVRISFSGSGIGSKGINALTFNKIKSTEGKIYSSIVRTDKSDIKGINVEVARLYFTVDSSISSIQKLPIMFTSSGGVLSNQSKIDFNLPSNTDSITIIPEPNNINKNLQLDSEIKIYPNPSDDIITIEIPYAYNSLEINLINQLGQKLPCDFVEEKNNTLKLIIADKAPGIYILEIKSTKFSLHKKLYLVK